MQVSAMRNGETHLVFSLPKRDAKRCLKKQLWRKLHKTFSVQKRKQLNVKIIDKLDRFSN